MAEHVERVRSVDNGNEVRTERVVNEHDPVADKAYHRNVAQRIIWYIGGILLALLTLRFILVLLGANPSNGFTNFIYNVSHPFVAPFFGVFSYDNLRYGVSRFEGYTLLAIVIYALIIFAIARLFTLTRRDTRDTTY